MNIEGFLTHLKTRGYSKGTITSYRYELLKFQAYLRECKLQVNQVKPKRVEMYMRWRDPASEHRPASTRRLLAVLSSFYDFLAVMSNEHVRNPVRPLRRPRRQPPNPQPLTELQVATLMEGVTSSRDAAIIGLLLHSGLRLSELLSLNRDSIKVESLGRPWENRTIGVGRVVGKGRKEREFLVNISALKLVHSYLKERSKDDNPALFLSNRRCRIDQRSVQHLLRVWCTRLALPPLHPHQLRATYATRLNKMGVPTGEISMLLGHANFDTTLQYIRPDLQKTRTEYFAAYEKLS